MGRLLGEFGVTREKTVKHTPGPWAIGRKFVVGPVDDSDTQSFGMIIGVADVYGDNRDADARLIAAAPELLEALVEIRRIAADIPAVERNPRFAEASRAALAAIAKAEGRS